MPPFLATGYELEKLLRSQNLLEGVVSLTKQTAAARHIEA
jgi:hypothetical protein